MFLTHFCREYSKYRMYLPHQDTPHLYHWSLYCLSQLSRKSLKITYVSLLYFTSIWITFCAEWFCIMQGVHRSDAELNARKCKVLEGTQFIEKKWRDVKVGDICRIESSEFFPADLLLISSSEPEGLCYIETSNLDG